MSDYRYLLAVDPSLTCSGWALFNVSGGNVAAVGKIRAEPAALPMAVRLNILHRRIDELISTLILGRRDVLVCEAPTTMRDPHGALKVEQVRGMFESAARERGLAVPGRINPRTVQFEVMGLTGKQLVRSEVKLAALRSAQVLYGDELAKLGLDPDPGKLRRHQDIVDALLVGRVAISRLQSAARASMSLEELFEGQGGRSRRTWRVRPSGLS